MIEYKTTVREVADQLVSVYEDKNKDYNNSFDNLMDEYGLIALAIRLSDKLSRFKNLIDNKANVKDESILDTLGDAATYAMMGIAWYQKKNQKKPNANIEKYCIKDCDEDPIYDLKGIDDALGLCSTLEKEITEEPDNKHKLNTISIKNIKISPGDVFYNVYIGDNNLNNEDLLEVTYGKTYLKSATVKNIEKVLDFVYINWEKCVNVNGDEILGHIISVYPLEHVAKLINVSDTM